MKEFKTKTGENIKNAIYTFILSMVIFYIAIPECKIYLILFSSIWLWILLGYGNRKNREFLSKLICFTIGNIMAFGIMKLLAGGSIEGIDCIELVLLMICAGEIAVALCLVIIKRKNKGNESAIRIFDCRKYDLERIREFALQVEMLGINSRWGNGKTFVLEKLCEDEKIKSQFEIIRIDLLTCNLDEIETILMNELDKILAKYRIYSQNARQLRRMLGEETILKQLQEVLLGDNIAIASAFEGFKQDVQKLSKKIMIVYEDIDRITDISIIKKIFAISEKLAGQKILVVYQYDKDNLEETGLDRKYLEKYIPYVVNLTDMDYRTIINELWDELDMQEQFTKEDFINFSYHIPQNYEVKKMIGGNFDITFELKGISIRQVRIFMEEAKYLLKQNVEYQESQNKNTLIRFLYVKHLYHHIYEKLEVGKTIEESLKFKYDERNYTMSQLLYKRQKGELSDAKIKEMMADETNQEHYAVMSLFGYEYDFEKKELNRDNIANESKKEMEKRERIEKLNRLIWNLMGNGKSEFTDMENAIKQFVERILPDEVTDKEGAWKEYKKDMFNQKLWKDNGTIFRIGIDGFLPIFQGFRVWNQSGENWCKLLDFYDSMNEDKTITVEFIENLNNCDLHQRCVFVKAMELFCEYKIKGNMNKEKCFAPFIKKYLQNICWLGYSRRLEFEVQELELRILKGNDDLSVNQICDAMIVALEKEKDGLVIEEAVKESELIQKFIRKIGNLILTEKVVTPREISFESSMKTVYKNQEEYDRLVDCLSQGKEHFMEEVKKSYEDEKIIPGELKELMKNKQESIFVKNI